MLEAAAAGLGIALLRLPTARTWIARGALAIVSDRHVPNPAAHHIVTRRSEVRPAVIEIARRLMAAAALLDP